MEEIETKKIKVWQLLIIIIFFALIIIVIFKVKKTQPQIKERINKNYKNQVINNINFTNIKIYEKNNNYYFTAKAINNTKKTTEVGKINIKLDNYEFYSYIGNKIKPNEYKMIFMETKTDISKIKNITFNFNKK